MLVRAQWIEGSRELPNASFLSKHTSEKWDTALVPKYKMLINTLSENGLDAGSLKNCRSISITMDQILQNGANESEY